jgi:uncharacterized membrane protein
MSRTNPISNLTVANGTVLRMYRNCKHRANQRYGMGSTERSISSVSSGQAWVVAAVLSISALIGGVLAFPHLVYDRFIWQYFWGPVYADANNAACAVLDSGTVTLLQSGDACQQAAAAGKIVASPGYTLVSEAGYAIILLFMLAGVLLLLQRLDIGHDRRLFFALVPFMLFGGALRVVEDATDVALNAGVKIIGYPFNTLIISPIIYFVVFFITLASLLICVGLYRRDIIERYAYLLAGIGSVAFLLTTFYVGYLVLTVIDTVRAAAGFYPQITVIVVLFSVLISGGVYLAIERFAPWMNAGTERIGLVVLFGQTLDGVANVIASDWAMALGLPFEYSAKHPINRIIVDITTNVLPQSLINTIGTSWPFLLVKVIAAVLVIALFDEKIFDESPRYALLLLVAIVAVGLGPGTRDMIRATFGI